MGKHYDSRVSAAEAEITPCSLCGKVWGQDGDVKTKGSRARARKGKERTSGVLARCSYCGGIYCTLPCYNHHLDVCES